MTDARRWGVAAAAGGSLFVLGVREAALLRDADLDTACRRPRQLGAARISAGLVLLGRPSLLGGALGRDEGGRGSEWLPRLVAVRELCLGVGAVASSRADADPWPWLMTIATVDGAQGAVLLTALHGRAVDPDEGWAYAVADWAALTAVVTRVVRLNRARQQ